MQALKAHKKKTKEEKIIFITTSLQRIEFFTRHTTA